MKITFDRNPSVFTGTFIEHFNFEFNPSELRDLYLDGSGEDSTADTVRAMIERICKEIARDK